MCMYMICLQASRGRCAKTEPSSYGFCETKNKWCGSCILTTKPVTTTNYNNKLLEFKVLIFFLQTTRTDCQLQCASDNLDILNFAIVVVWFEANFLKKLLDQTEAKIVESGQKWHKNNHLATFSKVQFQSMIHSVWMGKLQPAEVVLLWWSSTWSVWTAVY